MEKRLRSQRDFTREAHGEKQRDTAHTPHTTELSSPPFLLFPAAGSEPSQV